MAPTTRPCHSRWIEQILVAKYKYEIHSSGDLCLDRAAPAREEQGERGHGRQPALHEVVLRTRPHRRPLPSGENIFCGISQIFLLQHYFCVYRVLWHSFKFFQVPIKYFLTSIKYFPQVIAGEAPTRPFFPLAGEQHQARVAHLFPQSSSKTGSDGGVLRLFAGKIR